MALCVLVTALIWLAGCGGSEDPRQAEAPRPHRVPSDAIAAVGATPVSIASFRHWLPVVGEGEKGSAKARKATTSFLVKAQWLEQQAEADGMNQSAVNKLVARRVAGPEPPGGLMTHSDRDLQARLDIISAALRQRYAKVHGPPSPSAIASYYKVHRSEFTVPPVRKTLMVITHSRATALLARAALQGGEKWAAVARRWSVDSSAAIGGVYAVVPRISPPPVVHAAFSAPRNRLVGPLRARPMAAPQHPAYYLFEVVGSRPGSREPLARVRPQIRDRLESRRRGRALAAFERSFERRWRIRTLCAPAYLVPQCRNYRAAKAGNKRL